MQEDVSNRILTIPNLLSLVRLLLLPVFFVLLVNYKSNVWAFIVLLVASLTDLVDGFIARHTNSVTRLGKLLDPFVDRIFIVVGVIAIFLVGRLPLWILAILLARDAVMMVLTIYQKTKYNRDFNVVFIGKLTTTFLMAGFCSLVLLWPMLPGANIAEISFLPGWGAASTPLGSWLLYCGVILSMITAGIYLYQGTRPEQGDELAKVLLAQKQHLFEPSATTAQKNRLRYARDSKNPQKKTNDEP